MYVLLLDLGLEMRGGQRQVWYLAHALAQQQNSIVLTACPADSSLAAGLLRDGLPVLPLPGRIPYNPLVLRALARCLQGMDIVHTHDAHAASAGAFFKSLYPGIRLIHSRRVSYALHSGIRLWKYLRADAVVGVSREISEGMIRAGIPADRVYTISSGIDPQIYMPKVPRGSNAPFLFQSIGACTPQKGYDVLLHAMRNLYSADLPPWAVRIVGDGYLKQFLLEKARALGIENRLCMPGRLDSRDVLPDCDALVVPSVDGEGSSGTIKEGWATGVPVICSALPSNLELIHDGENGLTAAVGDPHSLSDAMQRCLLDTNLRARLVAAGKCSVQNFTHRRMAAAYLNLYTQLLQSKKKPNNP